MNDSVLSLPPRPLFLWTNKLQFARTALVAGSLLGPTIDQPLANHLVKHWPTIGKPLANHWPAFGQPLASSRPTVGQPLANRWPNIGQQAANHWPTIGQPLANHLQKATFIFRIMYQSAAALWLQLQSAEAELQLAAIYSHGAHLQRSLFTCC